MNKNQVRRQRSAYLWTPEPVAGGSYLSLPYTFDASTDLSGSSGDLSNEEGWTAQSGRSIPQIITSNLADNNSFTPSGVTKGIEIAWGATRDGALLDLPAPIDPSLTEIRIAWLAYGTTDTRFPSFNLENLTAAEFNAGGTITGKIGAFINISATPDTASIYSRYDNAADSSEINNALQAANGDARRYHWGRAYQDFTGSGEVGVSLRRAEDDSQIWADTEPMNATGASLGHVQNGLKMIRLDIQLGTSTTRLVRFWIGSGDDDWPSVAP